MSSYSEFADLCITLYPSSSWPYDMARRSGEPALFAYMVDTACLLAIGRKALDATYERTPDGVAILPGEPGDSSAAAGTLVMAFTRFFERRMTEAGHWKSDLLANALKSCPEIETAQVGRPIIQSMNGVWLLPMLQQTWMPAPAREMGPEMGVEHVASR